MTSPPPLDLAERLETRAYNIGLSGLGLGSEISDLQEAAQALRLMAAPGWRMPEAVSSVKVPHDEVWFMQDGKVIGRIINAGPETTAGETNE